MKRLELKPNGFPCRFEECPPGLFLKDNDVCLKTEYGSDEAFCDSGESFWGGTNNKEVRKNIAVQPLVAAWEEIE